MANGSKRVHYITSHCSQPFARFEMISFLGIILVLHCTRLATSNVLYQEIQMYHNETHEKADHAYQVVSKIYSAFRQWFFTITFCEFTYFENRILKYTETMDYGYPVLLLSGCPNSNKSRVKPKINIHGQTAYVITSDKLNIEGSEYVIEALIRTGVFQPRSPVIFIVNVPVIIDSYFFYTMKKHFQLLWSRSVTNSVVMLRWNDKLWTYSYNHFLGEIKDVSNVENLNSWLIRQFDDLHGHEFRLSVFKKLHQLKDKGPAKCDSRIAETVMSQLNATCNALEPRDRDGVGDFFTNGSSTGVTADLLDGYAELELNSRILKNSYYGYIDTTYPLMRDDLCFMVKNYEKQSTFSTVRQLISVTILVIFMFNMFSLMAMAIIARELEMRMWSIKEKNTIGTTVMNLFKCFVKQTVDIKLPACVYRCLVLMIMVYSLIVNCVIDGILTTAITYPRYWSHMNTMGELIHTTNLILAIHSRHFEMFNQSMDVKSFKILTTQNRIEIVNDKKIEKIILNYDYRYALLLRKEDLLFISRFFKDSNGRPLYRIMPHCPLPCSIVFGLRYGSPYLNKINNILHHLNQAGILEHWAKTEEINNYKILNVDENKELKKLTLGNLQELFVVWAFGLGISTIVLFVEVFANYKKLKGKQFEPKNNVLLPIRK